MFNPIRYVDNNFEDPHFSDANLRAFSEDFLVRLAQPENNPGSIYSTLLGDTSIKYNAYYGKMSSQAVKEAIAEGATVTRNNARKVTEEKISQLNNLAKYKFGEGSAVYQELFPLGAREYQDAREGDVGKLFDRFVVAATTHLDADYHTEVLAVDGLVDAFHLAYTARETVVSQVDILITGKNTDRVALTEQLTKNFLIIASNNIGNPDKFDDYYDPRFLPIRESEGEDDEVISGTMAENEIVAPINYQDENFTYPADTVVRVKNTSGNGANLVVYPSNTNNTPPGSGTQYPLVDGGTLEKTFAELGSVTFLFLCIQNPNAMEASWEIEIVE